MDQLFNKLHIFKAVTQYTNTNPVIYHMPGHKGGNGIPKDFWNELIKADVTEIAGTDNLYHPEGIIAEAMDECSKIFGTLKTFFLVNGSTVGIHAAMEAAAGEEKEIIMSRDCHKAVYNKVIMSGFTPHYISIGFDENIKIPASPNVQDVVSVMDKTGCKTVIITSPNYHGMCCNVSAIAKEVHKRDGILIVDEAHGAHFKFSDKLPLSAIDWGADLVIQSGHKTIPVINQGAYLHVCSKRVSPDKIGYILSMIQTSSPSYIILSMLEYAAVFLHNYGNKVYNELCRNIKLVQEDLILNNDIKIRSDPAEYAVDKDTTRIVVDAYSAGYTGFLLEDIFRSRYNIFAEAADLFNVILIATYSDPSWYLKTLHKALKGNGKHINSDYKLFSMENYITEQAMLPHEAYKKDKRKVKLQQALGLIARSPVIPYPPGIPLIVPGEFVTERQIEILMNVINSGGFVEGIYDNLYMDVVK